MLHSQGCDDEPLLEICEDDALTFVRIVDDGEGGNTGETTKDAEVSSDEEDDLSESESFISGDDQPSSEEEEFEG